MFFVETAFDFLEAALFLQLLQLFLEFLDFLGRSFLVAFEIDSLGEIELGQHLGHMFVAQTLVNFIEELEILVEHVHEARQVRTFEFGSALAITHDQAFRRALDQHFYVFAIVFDVLLRLAFLDRIQRRLCDEHIAALDQLLHVAEEECQQQGADVASVHVGVGHQNNFAVAQLARRRNPLSKCRCRAR